MGFLANIFMDLSFLMSRKISSGKRIYLFWLFFFYTFKFILYRLLGIKFKRANFGGMHFKFYDFRNFYYLFRTIFLQEQYYFSAHRPDPLIVDAGSNLGFSIIYFKKLYPRAHIIGFEPNPSAQVMLEENLRLNSLEEVQIIKLALSEHQGELEIYTNPHFPGDPKAGIYSRQGKGQKIMVPCDCLSRFIVEPVDLLKLDVEGVEGLVLKDLIQNDKLPLISEMIIEYHLHLNSGRGRLGAFLSELEANGFDYQIQAFNFHLEQKGKFQDVLIHAWKSNS